MNKTYKGWELIKAIADGEIKNGTNFDMCLYGRIYFEVVEYENNRLEWKPGEFDTSYLFSGNAVFKISELTEEIDIQSIKEIDLEVIRTFKDDLIMFNTLIKAIKKLDKQIKEKE